MQKMTEIDVSTLWQQTVKGNSSLATVDKKLVQVLYPGRPSDEPGADFKDAVLDISGRLTKGDIEIHVKSSDWRLHNHHRNKTYNGIVLHVVMWHDCQVVTRLENGGSIPTVSLDNQKGKNKRDKNTSSCCPGSAVIGSGTKILDILARAGEARFQEKQEAFCRELQTVQAGQCLYRGIMGALGYSRNIVPFQMVAGHLPLDYLESLARTGSIEMVSASIESLLLGTAGFLPSQRGENLVPVADNGWTKILEEEWCIARGKQALSIGDWHLFRIRPGNFPVRRLAGMAQLLLQYRQEGLLAGLTGLVEATSAPEYWGILEAGLVVTATDYWVDHFAPEKQCRRLDPFLIGRSRAVEIVINVLLPFYSAYYRHNGRSGTGDQSFQMYCGYPVATDNAIVRHMCRQLGLKPSQVKSARSQQGLLHLYKRFCTAGKCAICPLV